jgi:hypothetical protein
VQSSSLVHDSLHVAKLHWSAGPTLHDPAHPEQNPPGAVATHVSPAPQLASVKHWPLPVGGTTLASRGEEESALASRSGLASLSTDASSGFVVDASRVVLASGEIVPASSAAGGDSTELPQAEPRAIAKGTKAAKRRIAPP